MSEEPQISTVFGSPSLKTARGASKYLRYLLSILGNINKNASIFACYFSRMEPQIRFELMTCRLQGGCSTN